MQEQKPAYAVRLAQAVLITAVLGATSTGVLADAKNDKPKGQNTKGAAEHKVDTRRTGAAQHKVDARDNRSQGSEWWRARPGTTGGSGQRTGGSEWWRATPGWQHDSNRKPGASEWGRPNPQGRDEWRVRTGSGSQGSYYGRDNRYRPGQTQGPAYPHYYSRNDPYDHNRYEPPTHKDGRYYYPHWKTRPLRYGHWVFDNHGSDFCRRSIYFHFGLYPYVRVTRVSVLPYVSVGYGRVVIDSGRQLSNEDLRDLEQALSDIRGAWIERRPSLIERHVTRSAQIAVLLDGRYDYSLYSDDYIEMTEDIIGDVQTLSFTWERVRLRTDGDYSAFGRHVFRDVYGDTQTVYVSYTLRSSGYGYIITEVGSSATPML